MDSYRSWVLAAAVLAGVACGSDTPPSGSSDTDGTTGPGTGTDTGADSSGAAATNPLSVVTYNVGLAYGYIAEASGRKDVIIEALRSSDADVICVQELWTNLNDEAEWTTEVIDEVLMETAGTFPHQYWARTFTSDDTPPTGCTIEESEPLEACLVDNCLEVPPENLADCALEFCAEEFNGTSAGCMSCLAAHLGEPFEDIVAACKGVITAGILYDGHNGLAILSRHPLTDTDTMELAHALTSRSILRATVVPEDANPIDVYCTHLAADLGSTIAYPPGGMYTSFAEENAAQAGDLLNWVDTTSTSPAVLVTGDFNHGPMTGDGDAELPDNYQLFIDAGYSDPIAESGASCTYCDDNSLVSGGRNALIDHVYVQGNASVEQAAVIYDDLVPVMTAADGTQMLHRSDHYGVRVDLLH